MIALAVTTGDQDGIGLEVSAKSLFRLGPQQEAVFVLFRSADAPKKYLSLIDRKFKRKTVHNVEQALSLISDLNSSKKTASKNKVLIDVANTEAPPLWVESSARLCFQKKLSGIVTAPMSKEIISSLGWKDRGHTEILQRVCGVERIHQAFIGKHFSVLLATAHISLNNVSGSLHSQRLSQVFSSALELRSLLAAPQRKKPIALVGLNPHAGEGGILGREEIEILSPFCRQNKIVGPLSPDAAFLKKNWDSFSMYICCYHDQGLIPFKLVHGQESGVHVTMGLPFPRTSVDHGTAKDIFGKNIAKPNSMIEALQMGLQMCRA